MENISLKLESKFSKKLERTMQKNGYATKTEFIREALRDKVKELEKQGILKQIEKLFGSSKHKTTDEQLHKAREKAFEELDKELG